MMTERNTQLNKTIQAGAWNGRATIPAVEGIPSRSADADRKPLYQAGDMVGNYVLTKLLCMGSQSSLFLAEGRRQDRVVVKLYDPGTAKTSPALRRLGDILRRGGCAALMPLLSYGDLQNGVHYEVMPVYQQGTLEGARFTEEDLVQKILPQLNEALKVLGDNHLVHNDIKPANIFWKDRGKMQIVLGDYDCISSEKEEKTGGTLLYMAPERIYSDGAVHTGASDYCSLGLTLITLLTGKALLDEGDAVEREDPVKLKQFLYRRWQRQVSCPDSLSIAPKTRDLLDRLIQQKPQFRYGSEYISSWLQNDGLGVVSYREKTQKKTIKGLRYRGKLILDIPELISVLGTEWEFGTFMLKQHQLDDFVRQFDGNYYTCSQEYSVLHDTSEGLFKLMQTIAPSSDFYWLGVHYRSLEDFVDRTEAEESYGVRDPFCHFCRAGLLSFYEKRNGADETQIARAKEIETTGKRSPELAVKQLQISLRQKPDFVWQGSTLLGLDDLFVLLESDPGSLDKRVEEFYGSKAAKVWLDYIGQGSLLQKVEKKMLNV